MDLFERIAADNFGKYSPKQIETDIPASSIQKILLDVGKKYEPKFKIETKEEIWLYTNLIYYFQDNPKCEWDLSKGLFFHGTKGVGKSFCLKIIKRLYYYGAGGTFFKKEKVFKSFGMENLKNETATFREYISRKANVFCDEVMRETADDRKVIVDYGTYEQPFSTGLHQMYRNYCDEGKLYHFTTNYWNVKGKENGELLSDVYGGEIHDRLKEMCNIIELKGESYRK